MEEKALGRLLCPIQLTPRRRSWILRGWDKKKGGEISQWRQDSGEAAEPCETVQENKSSRAQTLRPRAHTDGRLVLE